ncbi:hypothetical protein AYO40_04250 [Planctomycetaceae bacterium SCGC AG-212-D15]|nr:hypothetical protein AYO40_04250 [Planctomycetaceae bacterium SCGC AG-212-D15]
MKTRILALLVGLGLIPLLGGADWPQFRGPKRDGHSADKGLLKQWPAAGPKLLWTFKKTGLGYSGPAVVGDRLYIMGARDEAEFLIALDLKDDGKELWSLKLGPIFSWKGNTWNEGPSATPTVDGELVFALSGQGDLVCATTAGEQKWRKSMTKDLNGEVNPIGGAPAPFGWGYTWSPLVDGDKVICLPGGKDGLMAALDKNTGKLLWRSKEVPEQATYSSPIVAEIGGVRQYIAMTALDERKEGGTNSSGGLLGIAPADGKLLWYFHRQPGYSDCVIPTPIHHEGQIYTTVGFNLGCDLISVTKKGDTFTAKDEYDRKTQKNLINREGGVVLLDGKIYGHSFEGKAKGWNCQEWKTGKTIWTDKKAKFEPGSIIYADGLFYIYGAENGTCVLVKPNGMKWDEISRFDIPEKSKLRKQRGEIWTHPVIANGKLFLRDQELLFCFDIADKK